MAVRQFEFSAPQGRVGVMTQGVAEKIEGYPLWSVVVAGAVAQNVVVAVSNDGTNFVTHTTVTAGNSGLVVGAAPYSFVKFTQSGAGAAVTSVTLHATRSSK